MTSTISNPQVQFSGQRWDRFKSILRGESKAEFDQARGNKPAPTPTPYSAGEPRRTNPGQSSGYRASDAARRDDVPYANPLTDLSNPLNPLSPFYIGNQDSNDHYTPAPTPTPDDRPSYDAPSPTPDYSSPSPAPTYDPPSPPPPSYDPPSPSPDYGGGSYDGGGGGYSGGGE